LANARESLKKRLSMASSKSGKKKDKAVVGPVKAEDNSYDAEEDYRR
jgi:hypothetical protein